MVVDSFRLYDVCARKWCLLEDHHSSLFLVCSEFAKQSMHLAMEQLCSPAQSLVQLAGAQEILDLRDPVILGPFVRISFETRSLVGFVKLLNSQPNIPA